ncbi:MAG: NAD(P)/FAD-dependent oxidoreductase [Planctomycetota bacterium]|nr:NAD(P)/FAD-dependent oxidoreductase [Planctomycetota bacterium]
MSANRDQTTTTWRIFGLELALGEPEALARERAARSIGVDPARMRGFRFVRKALDARKRDGQRKLKHVLCADVIVDASFRSAALARAERSGTARRAPPDAELTTGTIHATLRSTPTPHVVVVGSGPAGLFAAHVLARAGMRVTIVDRGSRIDKRGSELVAFHRSRTPNPESNLLFGEGGAGTYSDGKIYTRVDDPLEVPILEEIVACGAQPAILYDSRAHIGTDRLHVILPKLRERLEAHGSAFVWNTRVDGLVHENGRISALKTTAGELGCDAVIFAPGHSARDTWAALHEQGVAFEAKPFQLGVRIEHSQELVTRGQFGDGPGVETLGPASYALVAKPEDGVLGAHSFCMCPGGRIVASVNEAGMLCTNGMSNSTHSSRYANAAIVTTFGPRDFGTRPFDGVEFQRAIERRFFEAGGGDYRAPAQRATDFLSGRESRGEMRSSFGLGLVPGRIDELVPPTLRDALRHAITRFDRSIPGFAGDEGILVGIESRSSGPVQMPRDPATRRARGFTNFYPVGEGAGFAGGIMSAALDGAHSALALLEHGLID